MSNSNAKVESVTSVRMPCSKINIPAIRRDLSRHDHKALRDDIERQGLQVPITVKELRNGRYRLLDGFKRLMACLDLNHDMIDCRIIPWDSPMYVETDHASYARHLRRILKNMSIEEASQRIGRSVEWIQHIIDEN